MATGLVEPRTFLLTGGAAPELRANAAGQPLGATTNLQCGGCQASARHAQNEPGYGRLVRAFPGRHESCSNAVNITCPRGGHTWRGCILESFQPLVHLLNGDLCYADLNPTVQPEVWRDSARHVRGPMALVR